MDTIRRLTVASALAFLASAGEAGATTTEIALAHDYPASYHQRSNRVSQVMLVLKNRGWAEPAGTERSPLYRGNPVSRWRITDAGYDAHAENTAVAQAQAQARRAAGEDALRHARQLGAREQALAAVRDEITALVAEGGLRAITPAWRAAKIAGLRAVPCTLAEIGELFGLTRERVRVIAMTQDPRHAWCKQPHARQDPAAGTASRFQASRLLK
jgi:hypothetical protein